jgi:hypothetical protein
MNEEQYRLHCLEVLGQFTLFMQQQSEASSPDDPIRELSENFTRISRGENLYQDGPDLVAKLFASCPHLSPAFPRELLWFLGGDCLHNMPDEEIALYQQLDELRQQASARGEILNLHDVRAKLLKLQ